MMRIAFVLLLASTSAFAQGPLVRIVNTDRPASKDFQVGDHFEILITGPPNQPFSVRTSMAGRTDWGPIAGSTDSTGRWSTSGRFEKSDFGGWSEIWTVGGKLAGPAIHFYVGAPCLPGRPAMASQSGPNTAMQCETAEGQQTFVTPSSSDPFRTPDGRIVAGEAQGDSTQDEYHMKMLEYAITSGEKRGPTRLSLQSSSGGIGDHVSELIERLIGVNALSEDELRNVLSIVRATFEKPETIARAEKAPLITVPFLQKLAEATNSGELKQEIAETITYVQGR